MKLVVGDLRQRKEVLLHKAHNYSVNYSVLIQGMAVATGLYDFKG